MVKKILTPRLAVSRMSESDREFFIDLNGNQAAREFLGGPVPPEESTKKFEAVINRAEGYAWVVSLRYDSTSVGLISLSDHLEQESPELSFVFHPSHWGQGFALEACRAVMIFANYQIGIANVVAETQTLNSRSCHLLEKLGFRVESQFERFGAEQTLYRQATTTSL